MLWSSTSLHWLVVPWVDETQEEFERGKGCSNEERTQLKNNEFGIQPSDKRGKNWSAYFQKVLGSYLVADLIHQHYLTSIEFVLFVFFLETVEFHHTDVIKKR